MQKGEAYPPVNVHRHFISDIRANDDYFVTGSQDKTAKLCDLWTGKILQSFEKHTDYVNAVDVGDKVVTGSRDCSVRLWDIETGKQLDRLNCNNGVTYVRIKGNQVFSASAGGYVRIWDIREPTRYIQTLYERINMGNSAMDIGGDVTWALLACGKSLQRWDLRKLSLMSKYDFDGYIKTVTYGCHGTNFAVASDGLLWVNNNHYPNTRHTTEYLCLNSRLFMEHRRGGMWKAQTRICDAETGKQFIEFDTDYVFCIALTETKALLSDRVGYVSVYNIWQKRKTLKTFAEINGLSGHYEVMKYVSDYLGLDRRF